MKSKSEKLKFKLISMITLQVNGDDRTCEPNLTMIELLKYLGLNPRLVAVEYNGEILHRQLWENTIIQNHDRLEIVTIVGGG
ncbi:thiamine biosynthesis protein [Pseudanabaena sp. ABRG5-3]|nr:thiamine biosynthesis protein [Pseudanabaena sp. ABRG5-3]